MPLKLVRADLTGAEVEAALGDLEFFKDVIEKTPACPMDVKEEAAESAGAISEGVTPELATVGNDDVVAGDVEISQAAGGSGHPAASSVGENATDDCKVIDFFIDGSAFLNVQASDCCPAFFAITVPDEKNIKKASIETAVRLVCVVGSCSLDF